MAKSRMLSHADLWQFLRFCIVGSLNAVIDFATLNVLLWVYPTTETAKILLYNSFAVLLASTNSFFWNKYWTFGRRQAITLQEVSRFVVLASATTGMNDLLVLLLSALFPGVMRSVLLGANALKLGAIVGTTSISFFGMRLWVFFQSKYQPVTLEADTQIIFDDFVDQYDTLPMASAPAVAKEPLQVVRLRGIRRVRLKPISTGE